MSEQVKHTPGPWHIVSNGEAIWAGQEHGRVCMRPNHSKQWNWPANARLIAAAPELLAFALEFLGDYQSEDGLDSMKRYAEKARASIAKATGSDHA